MTHYSTTKTLTITILLTALLAFVVIYFGMLKPFYQSKKITIDGVYLPTSQSINLFQLTDNHGHVFTQDDLKNHWSLLFFGFTNCGMVCPTTLSALNQMYKTLQTEIPDNQLPQVVFISVDPDRDSIKRINDYVTAFNPHFIGARTDIQATIQLEKQFHIVAAKLQVDGEGKNNYTINHSAEILVVNPKGQLQAYLSYPHTTAELVKDYKSLLKSA